MNRIAIAAGALALVGAGYWYGTSGHTVPEKAEAAAPRSAAIAAPVARPAPTLPRPTVDPTLAQDLADRDPAVRRAAIREAAREHAGVDVLAQATRDGDQIVAGTAMTALGAAYAAGQLTPNEMLQHTQAISDPKVRSVAINALGMVASDEGVTYLANLARASDVGDRATAANLLQHQEPAAAMPLLIALLGDADAHVRASARSSLVARSRGRDFAEDRAAWQAWWDQRSR